MHAVRLHFTGDITAPEGCHAENARYHIDSGLATPRAGSLRLSASQVDYQPSPLLGQHTAEVLAQELGLDAAAVKALRESGAL